jgi:hypothetical protein
MKNRWIDNSFVDGAIIAAFVVWVCAMAATVAAGFLLWASGVWILEKLGVIK